MKNYLLTTLAVMGALSMSLSAQADWKSEHGATCQAYFGSQEANIGKYANGATNLSTAYRWVSCGVPRDNVLNTNGTSGLWVYVNSATNLTTTCYHRSAFSNGNPVQTIGPRYGTNGWVYLDSSASAGFGTYHVYCYLPPGGRLSTVLVNEFADTNVN